MTNGVVIKDGPSDQWFSFLDPKKIIETHSVEEVLSKLCLVEKMVQKKGLYAAGFISYEAAPAFDSALNTRPPTSFPLLWFGLYNRSNVAQCLSPSIDQTYTMHQWIPSVSQTTYDKVIAQIKSFIAQGETYQVNYTFRLCTQFSGSALALFLDLVQAQQDSYAAYVDTGRFAICSASPELFFRLDDHRLISRPMKGTAARGRTLTEDKILAQQLYHSEKNRAENIMIVDMIRNDMGRIATTGSVEVSSLFDVEKYPTVLQMTSTITSTTHASLCDVMTALFPCASITGAPKPRTMEIIAKLETSPRYIYTGCIGFITPHRKAQFNVAIRTVLIDRTKNQAEYGVGGGIMWDSASHDEYTECRIKTKVLTQRRPEFSLLETLLWTPSDGYFLLTYHLQRLQESAAYFDFQINRERIQEHLMILTPSLPKIPHKVRLIISKDGTINSEVIQLNNNLKTQPVLLRLAPTPVDSTNPFLYHKTTHRQVYDTARAACPDCDDVLLWNERGEITETSIANIVVQVDEGELVTPPVQCGLLPGTFRAWLLDQKKIREKIITIEELKQSKKIYLINSVRKWYEAHLK